MAGATLVRTTLTGVRPLGVRGEPLHHAEAQIRAVVRRRLGERHFNLLAEPEPHDLGGRIDWYSACTGAVQPSAELPEADRAGLRTDIDALLADIDRLGQELEASAADDARLAGRSLRLAAQRPSDDYLFLVGDQPVIVCWGYDTEAAGAVLPPAFIANTTPATPPHPAAPPIPRPVPVAMTPVAAATLSRERFPWLVWLLAGLVAIAILMMASWLLRQCMPVPPDLRITELPPLPPPPQPPPDPTIGLRDDVDAAQRDEAKLRATLASLRDELERRYRQCRPPIPDQPETRPGDVLRLPEKPTDDYSFLKGCWRGDAFRYTPRHPPGHHTYCFDERGNGKLVFRWQSGVTCEAPATARYEGDTLHITDANAVCSDGSRWTQDRLVCTNGIGSVAQCGGETNIHLPDQGVTRDRPTRFSVRLTKQ